MPHGLQIDPADAAPIWQQIQQGVAHLVASGALAAGAAVPSVRDLARDLRVNPATVSKAYQKLVDAGMLVVRRGEGTFVADEPPVMDRAGRRQVLTQAATRYAVTAHNVGAGDGESLEQVRTALGRLRPGREKESLR